MDQALRRGVSRRRSGCCSRRSRSAAPPPPPAAIELGGAAVLVAPRAAAPLVAALSFAGRASASGRGGDARGAVPAIGDRLLDALRAVGAATRGAAARRRAVDAVRWALLGGFAAAVATRRQLWPFTPVPMFSHARDASWTRECLTADQAAQLAREALPSPTAFHETWYRLDAVLVPPAGASHPARRTLHPRHLAMAGEGHARGSLLVPEAFRPHVLDAAFGASSAPTPRARRRRVRRRSTCRASAAAWAADVAPLAALLPLLEAHADYVAGYHRSDGEVCNASAAAEQASRPAGAAVMGLELMLNSCEMGIVPLAAVRVDGGALGCPRHRQGRRRATAGRCPILRRRRGRRRRRRRRAPSGRRRASAGKRTTCSARARRVRARRRRRPAAAALRAWCEVLAAPRPRTGLRRVKRRAR